MLTINDFFKILKIIQGTDVEDITKAVKAIAQSEKGTVENLFTNIIDQYAHYSTDYQRLRAFIRDWYATHRTISTVQTQISDPYSMPNDQLDELFQSFGYKYSSSLRDPVTNEPLLAKVNFILDLISLYKRKGTPQTLVDVLQYYGLNIVDIYEFALQFDDRPGKNQNDLIFKGSVVAGTSGSKSPLYLPYQLLTIGDPHWLYTEDQIRALINTTHINFPSQSPYFAVKPVFDEFGSSITFAILFRQVQDQYDAWVGGTDPPKNALATITGDKISVLALYLACVYIFNKEYSCGVFDKGNYLCYDGTSVLVTDIINEYQQITSQPKTRAQILQKLAQYYDQFTREDSRNFLQNITDAGSILALVDPTFKTNLDSVSETNPVILGSLLRDLGEWIRANISFGFINVSYLMFGIDALFSQLRDVIEFFKPYRARLVPLEMLQFTSRLENSIVVEDKFDAFSVLVDIHDYVTGDSNPCCANPVLQCPDSTDASQYYSRDTYDCGSYYDIGACTDIGRDIFIEFHDIYRDSLVCSFQNTDSTAIVTSEILVDTTSTFVYYQSGGFAKFDSGGTFDCTNSFDLVFIEMVDLSELPGILLETGYYLLQENTGRILLE